jgi:hypothetical protein
MKRFQPKDRGKSFSIFKRLCHITIEVEEGTPKLTKAQQRKVTIRSERLARKPKAGAKTETAAAESK